MALLISILQLAAVLLELFVLVVSIFKTRGDAPKHKKSRRNQKHYDGLAKRRAHSQSRASARRKYSTVARVRMRRDCSLQPSVCKCPPWGNREKKRCRPKAASNKVAVSRGSIVSCI